MSMSIRENKFYLPVLSWVYYFVTNYPLVYCKDHTAFWLNVLIAMKTQLIFKTWLHYITDSTWRCLTNAYGTERCEVEFNIVFFFYCRTNKWLCEYCYENRNRSIHLCRYVFTRFDTQGCMWLGTSSMDNMYILANSFIC